MGVRRPVVQFPMVGRTVLFRTMKVGNNQLTPRIPIFRQYHDVKSRKTLDYFPSRPQIHKISVMGTFYGQKRGAAFWKVGTNLRIFKQMLQESGDNEWKYRLLLFLGLFIVINFLFNVMMAVLTNIYLERLQPSSRRFGFLVNSEYKHGVVDEMITIDDQAANKKYLRCLRMLARKNGLKNKETEEDTDKDTQDSLDSHYKYDIDEIIMGPKQLDDWYYEKKDLNYISMYCDLGLRYALTLPSTQSELVYKTINIILNLCDHYSKLAHQDIGSYPLMNKALRTKADILKYNKADFSDVESCIIKSIKLVEKNEFGDEYTADSDPTIVPEGVISTNNLMNSLLDLCSFYSDSRIPKYLTKSLAILVSELRSLEGEYRGLDKRCGSNALYNNQKSVSTSEEKRLMELKFEKIPLIKMDISELLWNRGDYDRAIEMAKDSAQQSEMNSHGDFNSAKISKLGFQNLATMYAKHGDSDASKLCQMQCDSIEIPLDAFSIPTRTVRDAVLEYWFGAWGKFLFPG